MKPSGKAGFGQLGLGGLGIEVIPGIANTGIRDGARGEVGCNFGTLRVEGVHDALAVDAHGNSLANLDIVKGREGIGHADVEDVQRRAVGDLQIRVSFDDGKVIRADIVKAIDRAGLEFQQAGGGFG